jgi:cephalosporin hydroxylase
MTALDLHLTALEPSHLLLATKAVQMHGALQDEWEFAVLMDIVRRAGVSTMLEIGSHAGGSLWAWSQIVPNVLGVTLEAIPGQSGSHGATLIQGDSTMLDTQWRVHHALGGRPVDFVFIDGGHDQDTCLSDFEWATRLVGKGLIAIHDINLHIRFPVDEYTGPRIIWDTYKAFLPHFEIANKTNEDPGVGIFWIR